MAGVLAMAHPTGALVVDGEDAADACIIEAARAAAAAPAIQPQFDASGASRIGTAIGRNIVRDSERKKALKACRARAIAGSHDREASAAMPQDAAARHAIELSAPLPGGAGSLVNAGRKFRDCPECPEMIVLPAGSFIAGPRLGEQFAGVKPFERKEIRIPRSFAIGTREVTVAEYRHCAEDGGCVPTGAMRMTWSALSQTGARSYRAPDGQVRRWTWLDLPMSGLSHDDAAAFATWLSRKTSRSYRLPSSAEWEYAARAGSETRFPRVAGPTASHAAVPRTAPLGIEPLRAGGEEYPVAIFPPNQWGLYDVLGGVGELTADCADVGDLTAMPADGSPNASRPCLTMVVRGGADFPEPTLAYWTAAFRSNRTSHTGVRLAADL